jgi:hypothetical protein
MMITAGRTEMAELENEVDNEADNEADEEMDEVGELLGMLVEVTDAYERLGGDEWLVRDARSLISSYGPSEEEKRGTLCNTVSIAD